MSKKLIVFVLLAVAAGATLASSSVEAAPRECEIAIAWVESNPGVLPQSYEEFSAFESKTWRKAIYSQLGTEARLALWKDHLAAVLLDPELSQEEREFLAEARANLTESLIASPSEESAAFGELAMEVLGKDLARRAFADLGAPEAVPAGAAPSEACSCSQQSDFCNSAYECGDDEDGCDVIQDECGLFWTHDCDGECLQPE